MTITWAVTVDAYSCALCRVVRAATYDAFLFLRRLLTMPVAISTPAPPAGLKSYYQAKIEAAELEINQKTQNLRRLEAQRNALNARGTLERAQL